MKVSKAVVQRPQADRDVEAAIDFYLLEAGGRAALGFVDALEHAFDLIGRQPGAGSSRYAHELDLPGLKCWPLRGYPYIVFYMERERDVDVWRGLHAASDIPAWMSSPPSA